jgi:hypothetical protein
MVEYYIRKDSNHSDHLPVWDKFLLEVEARRKTSYKMNACYLEDEALKVGVYRIWTSNPNLDFTGKLRWVVKFYKEYSIQQATTRRKDEIELRQALLGLVTLLQANPLNQEIQSQISELSARLQAFELRRAEGQQVQRCVKWKQYGDSTSKEFFKATKEYSSASSITELEDEHGVVFTDQNSLEQIFHRYYSQLYSTRT